LRGLLRYVYRNGLPVTVRDAVAVQRELAQRDLAPVVADPPAQRRIVVLAPHMDDEVFGCGGTLARAAAAGSEVRVVFLTDGARGYDPARAASLTESQRLSFERELVITRKDEARKAGALLGFAEPVFLDVPDGGSAPVADALQRAVAALRARAATAVPAVSHRSPSRPLALQPGFVGGLA
jgi:LmbE family N-acetylglucosaminyl deacetylase